MEEYTVDNWNLLQPSSWIENFAYVPSKKELSIEIKDSGEVYTYLDVPAKTANAMAEAESVGKFCNQNLKGGYQFTKEVRG